LAPTTTTTTVEPTTTTTTLEPTTTTTSTTSTTSTTTLAQCVTWNVINFNTGGGTATWRDCDGNIVSAAVGNVPETKCVYPGYSPTGPGSTQWTYVGTPCGYPPITTTTTTTTTTSAPNTLNIDYLLTGGGASGGTEASQRGGGGGAGRFVSASVTMSGSNSLPITIGSGGASSTYDGLGTFGNNGGDSTIIISSTTYTAPGGGGGAKGLSSSPGRNGLSGGSGGGGAATDIFNSSFGGAAVDGSPIVGFGNAGEGKSSSSAPIAGYGGGAGGTPTGLAWLDGTTYCVGGSGITNSNGSTAGSGGGGGGSSQNSGAGANGICIIRYGGAPVASGGTITQTGGYTYHTFTSSGNFTFSDVTTTTTSTTTTTTTAAPTTTTTTISYDYYIADEYTCTGCTLTGPTPVKFPAGTSVTIGKFYRTNPNTVWSYLITATSTPGGALTMDTVTYNSCAEACA
jgi:hypothetical protein